MTLDDATTINGIRVPLSAMRFHPDRTKHVHRLDRPSHALRNWSLVALAAWVVVAAELLL